MPEEVGLRGAPDRAVLSPTRLPLDGRELAVIFLGGAVGALLRVGLGEAFVSTAGSWPWAIFAINISGSLALAYIATRLLERVPHSRYPLALLGPGFCGTYTTFSTMQVEILQMLDHNRIGLAAGYAGASICAGYLAIWVGMKIARQGRAA